MQTRKVICWLTKENAWTPGQALWKTCCKQSPGSEAEMRNALRFAREKGMEKLGVYKEARAYHQKTFTKFTLQLWCGILWSFWQNSNWKCPMVTSVKILMWSHAGPGAAAGFVWTSAEASSRTFSFGGSRLCTACCRASHCAVAWLRGPREVLRPGEWGNRSQVMWLINQRFEDWLWGMHGQHGARHISVFDDLINWTFEISHRQVLAAGETRLHQVVGLDTEEALQKSLQLRDEAKAIVRRVRGVGRESDWNVANLLKDEWPALFVTLSYTHFFACTSHVLVVVVVVVVVVVLCIEVVAF